MNRLFSLLVALVMLGNISAQTIWHHPDSLMSLPHADSIPATEEYTLLTVVRSLRPDAPQLLWGIKVNDTLQSAVLTNAHYSIRSGISDAFRQRDYSRWSILYYHTGCVADTGRAYSLWLGPEAILQTDSAVSGDSLSADVEVRELLFVPERMSHLESASWQTYLALKHGITLDYAPYISPSGDTLWSAEEDYDFYNRIVGIGSDSLRQWSAYASSSLEKANMHISCHTPLEEGEYIVVGDDDRPEEWSLLPDGYNRLMRAWRLRTNINRSHSISLVWHPDVEVDYPDSVWLTILSSDGEMWERLHPDSVAGDTAWWFSLAEPLPSVCQLAVETLADFRIEAAPVGSVYDASSGTIALTGLDPEKIYTYSLYTNLGHLLFHPAPSRPDGIRVGALPNGIYRLEAFDDGVMVASVAVSVY